MDDFKAKKDFHIRWGTMHNFDGEPEYEMFRKEFGVSRQFTMMFLVFGLMQLFLALLARVPSNSFNFFPRFNPLFLMAWLSALVLLVIISQFGHEMF